MMFRIDFLADFLMNKFKTALCNMIFFAFLAGAIMGILYIPYKHYFVYKWAVHKAKDETNIHTAQLCRASKYKNRQGYLVRIQENKYFIEDIIIPFYIENKFPFHNKEKLFFDKLKSDINVCIEVKYVFMYENIVLRTKKIFIYDFV